MVISERVMEELTYGPMCHPQGIKGFGNPNADIMCIGIAPGRDEVRKGRPFTGPSGELLDALLGSVGIERDSIYTTNLVCIHNDRPDQKQIESCQKRLIEEIISISPKVIVLLGALATEVFIGKPLSGVNGSKGAVVWSNRFNCYMVPTFHPAAILRTLNNREASEKDRDMVYDVYRHLKNVTQVVHWPDGFKDRHSDELISPYADMDYCVIDSRQGLIDLLQELPRNEPVAIDVETYNPNVDQLDVWGDQLLSFSIATVEWAWVIPLEVIGQIKSNPIEWPELQWTMHNAQFDTQILYKNLGVWFTVHEDTMLQSYSLDERGGVHGLKPLAREYLGAGWWEQTRKKGKKRLDEIPREQLYLYNAKDAIYTARLCRLFRDRQVADNVRHVYEYILIPAVNAVKEIAYRGVRISKKKHLQFSIEWGQMYIDLEERLKEMAYEAGWPTRDIGLNSPADMSKFLYNILSLPAPKKIGKTGNPSTAMEFLKELKGQHEFVDEFIRYRHMARYYDTYITGLGNHIKTDSRLHPYVKIHGARTGRWSYGDPPMQTIPQTYEKEGVEADFQQTREMIIPNEKDFVFIESDFGKGEIWCAQAQSGDPQMLEDLLSSDYHATIAADVKRKPFEEVTKDERREAKTVTFGVMYYEEAYSLGRNIKRTTLEAQLYIDRFFQRNNVYKKYFDSIIEKVRQTGELVSVTGRKRRFIILDAGIREMKQAVNYPIQSALGDMTEIALIEIHNEFKKRKLQAYVLLQVHDSLLIECHKDILSEVMQIIHDVMTKVFFTGFPRLPIEMGSGKNWGKIKSLHDCMKHPNCIPDGCPLTCTVKDQPRTRVVA